MKKKLIIVIAAAIVIAAGYTGFLKYEQHKFVESITPYVKNASLRLANVMRYEQEETNITYNELFEKLESNIAEIDKRILDVQTISTSSNKEVTDPVLEYLKGSQEFIRALLSKYRKQIALSSASDWATSSIESIRDAGSYDGLVYASKAADKAIKELGEAEKEYNESIPDVRNATNKMKKVRTNLAASMPSDALVDAAIFEAVAKKNKINKIDTTISKTQEIINKKTQEIINKSAIALATYKNIGSITQREKDGHIKNS